MLTARPAGGYIPQGPGLGLTRDRYGRRYIRDVIVGLDGTAIKSYDDLYNALDAYQIGNTVTLTVERDGKSRKIQVTLVRID